MKYGDHERGQFSQAEGLKHPHPPPPPSLKEERLNGQKSQVPWVWHAKFVQFQSKVNSTSQSLSTVYDENRRKQEEWEDWDVLLHNHFILTLNWQQ